MMEHSFLFSQGVNNILVISKDCKCEELFRKQLIFSLFDLLPDHIDFLGGTPNKYPHGPFWPFDCIKEIFGWFMNYFLRDNFVFIMLHFLLIPGKI